MLQSFPGVFNNGLHPEKGYAAVTVILQEVQAYSKGVGIRTAAAGKLVIDRECSGWLSNPHLAAQT